MSQSTNEETSTTGPVLRTALGREEFRLFNQQLMSIAEAGLPLERALREMSRDVASSKVRSLLDGMAGELEKGRSMEDVFAAYEAHFPPTYGLLIKAGVKSGRLGSLLASLNRHLDVAQRTRQIVLEAVAYPMMVLFVVLGLTSLMIKFAVPAWRSMYNEFGGQLPLYSQVALEASRHLGTIWGVFLALLGGLGVAFLWLRRTEGGRLLFERTLLSLPMFGQLYRTATLTRFSDSMGVLVGAGTGLPESLRLGAMATGSAMLQRDCERIATELEKGKSLEEAATPGERDSFLPHYLLYSLQLGLQRNDVQDALYHMAHMYGDRTQALQGRLQAALLPVLLIFVGMIVGLLAVSMMYPYFVMFNLAKVH
jgi:type II secretory pathway component PulF